MSSYIQKVADKDKNQVFPITHERAVVDDNGVTIESKIQTVEAEIDELPTKEYVNDLVHSPNQEYATYVATSATTSVTEVLPTTGDADTIYRVSCWDGSANSGAGAYNVAVYSEYAWNGSVYIFLCVKSQIGEVFDISAYHSNQTYDDLADALGTGGANVPESLRKGGMSVKYVQTSDNKYVQYILMADSWSINTNDWERYNDVTASNILEADLDISDEQGNVLVRFQDGHIKTNNFDSSKDATTEERGLMSSADKAKLNTIEEGAEVNDVITDDVEGADLNISDEDGNILMQLKGGHIRTKNFDSKNNITEKFKDKKIAIIGDSISTYEGWLPSDIPGYDGETYSKYYPKGDVNDVSKTWWYKLANLLGLDPNTNISNCAWSGSRVSGDSDSTTSAAAGCSDRRISDLSLRFNGGAPDIIICFISCNDWGRTPNVPIGTWKVIDPIPSGGTITELRASYALMVDKLHSTYPLAKVFCCTNLDDFRRDATPGWPSNNNSGVSTYEWNQNIIEVAQALGCEIIDFNKCGINYTNIGTYYAVDDGLHPNDAGHTLMANKAFNELISKY